MAQKISEMTLANALDGTEEVEVSQDVSSVLESRRSPLTMIRDWLFKNPRKFFDGTSSPTQPVLTSGTQAELIAALGKTTGLGLVDDSAGFSNIRPNIGAVGAAIEIVSGEGTITERRGLYRFDTEGGAATDDLETITDSNALEGDIIYVGSTASVRDITFKDQIGNLRLEGDFVASASTDLLVLLNRGALWYELSRSNN